MRITASLLLLVVVAPGLPAQEWNSATARLVVSRAIERRQRVEADSGLQRYRATARGFVFFQAETGQGQTAVSRLIKADQLTVEVYWEAPNRSKQNVVAWRDRAYLPTDIRYHRDHLGIVTNDFGDAIRLGEGDEVRDVPHPLSPAGPALYDFALTDSITIATQGGAITVYALEVRPRDPTRPGVAGTLYLDTGTAATVRFRFSFTPAAYRQPDLEDITVVLEHALIDQRYWLPYRQEIEIRRRTAWLDIPIRTLIQGRWEIDDYDLTIRPAPQVFAGGAYGGLRGPASRPGAWTGPLDSAVAAVLEAPLMASPEEVRTRVEQLLGARIAHAGPPRLSFGSLSDLARVNRVQGLAVGLGLTVRIPGWRSELNPAIGIGTADGMATGSLAWRWRPGPVAVETVIERRVEDVGGWPVISGVLNSLMAQEGGNDHGDWVGMDRVRVALELPLDQATSLRLSGAVEESQSREVQARPSRGTYRPNPPLGVGTVTRFTAALRRAVGSGTRGLGGGLQLELGSADRGYGRAVLDGQGHFPLGPGAMQVGLRAGLGSAGMPAYQDLLIGGRATLPGEAYRAFGGRQVALIRAEWQVPVQLPVPGLSRLPSAGGSIVAPFVAVGWSGQGRPGALWRASSGFRPVVGVASELLFRVFRIEAGYSPRAGSIGLTADLSPSWWPIL